MKNVEPFKTVISGDHAAIAKLSMPDLEKILAATLSGMTVDEFQGEVKKWIATAKHPDGAGPMPHSATSGSASSHRKSSSHSGRQPEGPAVLRMK